MLADHYSETCRPQNVEFAIAVLEEGERRFEILSGRVVGGYDIASVQSAKKAHFEESCTTAAGRYFQISMGSVDDTAFPQELNPLRSRQRMMIIRLNHARRQQEVEVQDGRRLRR